MPWLLDVIGTTALQPCRKQKSNRKKLPISRPSSVFIASHSKPKSLVSLCYSCVPLPPSPFAQGTPLTGYFRSGLFKTCASVMLYCTPLSAFPFPSFPLLFEPNLLSVPSSAVATLPSLWINKLSAES